MITSIKILHASLLILRLNVALFLLRKDDQLACLSNPR